MKERLPNATVHFRHEGKERSVRLCCYKELSMGSGLMKSVSTETSFHSAVSARLGRASCPARI